MSASEHLRLSLRIEGKVTSITLKKNIIALWLIYGTKLDFTVEDFESLRFEVKDFVYKCIDEWGKPHGKGLSFFITNKMVSKILEELEYKVYLKIIKSL